jgi:curved DNA-binding protein CbpA
MKNNYFENCKTNEEVKKMYRKLASNLHPDCKNGNEADFVEMSAQYEKAFNKYKNVFTNAEGKNYEKQTDETFNIFKDIIDKIISFDIDIEIIGVWVWCTGNTKEYKEALKEVGFRWSQAKKAWSFHFGEWKKQSKRKYSLDEIRSTYGSEKVQREERDTLQGA